MSLYLVTGGAGFIGSHIVEELLGRGEQVRILDNFSTGKRENLQGITGIDDAEIIEGDIRSLSVCEKAVSKSDFILHLAALGSIPRSVDDPITSNDVNIGGTLNMLEASRREGVQRFVYAGSSSSYGDNTELPKVESQSGNPLSPYSVSKLAGEMYCSVFCKLFGVPTVTLRYFNVFGPRQDPDSAYAAVIPSFFSKLTSRKQPVIFGNGEQTRDFTYVKNVVNANLLACKAGEESLGRFFNIAGGDRVSVNTLFDKIQELTGTEIEPEYTEKRKGDAEHSWASIEEASRLLGYKPEVDVFEGLARSAAYYMNK